MTSSHLGSEPAIHGSDQETFWLVIIPAKSYFLDCVRVGNSHIYLPEAFT